MMKRNGFRKLLVSMVLASVSLLSSHSIAADEAALAQIEIQRAQLKTAESFIKNGGISTELKAFVTQMNSGLDDMEEIATMEVPGALTQKHNGGTTPAQVVDSVAARDVAREAFVDTLDKKVAALDAKIATGAGAVQILALTLAVAPSSAAKTEQGHFLALAAVLSQQQREIATNLLRNKKADLMAELEKGDDAAWSTVYGCIMSGRCG